MIFGWTGESPTALSPGSLKSCGSVFLNDLDPKAETHADLFPPSGLGIARSRPHGLSHPAVGPDPRLIGFPHAGRSAHVRGRLAPVALEPNSARAHQWAATTFPTSRAIPGCYTSSQGAHRGGPAGCVGARPTDSPRRTCRGAEMRDWRTSARPP